MAILVIPGFKLSKLDFQRVPKRFQRVSNFLKSGFYGFSNEFLGVSKEIQTSETGFLKGFNGFYRFNKGFLLFLRQCKGISYPMKTMKTLDETLACNVA